MVKIGIPLKYNHLDDGRCILYLSEKLRRTIQKAGGFIIPIVQVQDVDYCDTKFDQFNELTNQEKKNIDNYLDLVDGVIFPGGHKITPFDYYLLERCIERNIPTLGICLGMQLMSCFKEKFWVDKNDTEINHYQDSDNELTHKVRIDKDSKLYELIKTEEIMVNSFHKYHVSENEYFKTIAYSEDGYIEGVEFPGECFHVGIQWHPEISYDFDDNSKKIIDGFMMRCSK